MSYPPSQTEQELLALVTEAFEQHQEGNLQQAEALYRRLLTVIPDFWQLYYNLGRLLCDEQRYEEGIRMYEKAATLVGDMDSDLLFNIACCRKQLGHYRAAITSYRRALAIDPNDIDTHYNLASCYLADGNEEEAYLCYAEVLRRKPRHKSALNNQAYLCHKMGKTSEAMQHYLHLLELDPTNQSADHMLAALTGSHRSHAPDAYIKEVFDSYSDHYEKSLVRTLGYTLPETLYPFVLEAAGRSFFTTVIDLGCGTGLLGARFRAAAQNLQGIDISENMIKIARQKNIYDQLFVGEIRSFLRLAQPTAFDLLLAADVFTYIGDLQELLVAAHHTAKDDALLCFSVEDQNRDSKPMQLKENGRFAHAPSYIAAIAGYTGWSLITSEPLELRLERGAWVQGRMYALKKHGTT